MAEEKVLAEAVKDLRDAMGLSQVSFTQAIGKSLSTVQRFEKGESIGTHDLAALSLLAGREKRLDLAGVFRSALVEALGPQVVEVIQQGATNAATQKTAEKGNGDKRRIPA